MKKFLMVATIAMVLIAAVGILRSMANEKAINTERMENAVQKAAFGNPNLTAFYQDYTPNGSYSMLTATLEFDSQWIDPVTGEIPCPSLTVTITFSYRIGGREYTNHTATFTADYNENLPGTNQPVYIGYVPDLVLSVAEIQSMSVTTITAD